MTNLPIARILIVVAIALVGLQLGIWGAQTFFSESSQAVRVPDDFPGTMLPEPRPLPDFSLVDGDGRPFGPARLQGRWSLLFFGYTHCPDVCPTTLALFDRVAKGLKAKTKDDKPVQFVFVSVDPARDSPEHLKEYVEYFNPEFIGVTGSEEAIAEIGRAFGAVYMRVEGQRPEDYLIDHSSAVFLTDPQGRFAGVFSAPHDAERIAHGLNALL
jgi:protein SCO1/2